MRATPLLVMMLIAVFPAMAQQPAPDMPTQQQLIDGQLAAFVVEPADRARVFFLGFAGYGEQRVFAEEIKFAAARVAEKYGSAMRTLLLVNDRRDLSTLPLANHDNLRYSLRELARRMDPAKDVLFLALSSHGDKNAMIEVSNTEMPAVGLSAKTLARMLQQARIGPRVIVVSACYSGAFVKPLTAENSIVITASSKSRTSFGCSDERDLTYFGEAFYRDALPGAESLRAAVETARADIKRREIREGFIHSQPQAWFGPVVEELLKGAGE